jgi:hypothetical protein
MGVLKVRGIALVKVLSSTRIDEVSRQWFDGTSLIIQ